MTITTSTRYRSVLAAAAATVMATAPSIFAQNEPADCAVQVANLMSGSPRSVAPWEAARCPVTGPSGLAFYWSRTDRAASIDSRTIEASALLRDARLFRALSGVARSAGPRANRIAALAVLARYYDPRYGAAEAFLAGDEPGTSLPRRIGGRAPVVGTEPLPADHRTQIGALALQLATSDPDSGIRSAAHRLRQALAIDDPANNPIPDEAIRLVAGCGREVTVRSTADIDVTFDLLVPDERYQAPVAIRAGSAGKPAELHLVVPNGTVVARYGGRELTRLATRTGQCAPGAVRWP
jgi:hypothetical protein